MTPTIECICGIINLHRHFIVSFSAHFVRIRINVELITFHSRNKRKKVSPADSKQRSRKKKKQLELKNFYRFQIRQEKVEKLEELRQKFEEDKQRVAMMKESRKFKPF